MNEWTREDEEWANSPEVRADICRGLLDDHLGRMFRSQEVFSHNPYWVIRNKSKKLWWKVQSPFIKWIHRNCETCKLLKADILLGERVDTS